MGKMKRTKRFALMKRMIDAKEKKKKQASEGLAKKNPSSKQIVSKQQAEMKKALMGEVKRHEQVSSALYFRYNTQLGPPYHILLGLSPLIHEAGQTNRRKEGQEEGRGESDTHKHRQRGRELL